MPKIDPSPTEFRIEIFLSALAIIIAGILILVFASVIAGIIVTLLGAVFGLANQVGNKSF